jgi:hypothetical protein
MHQREYDQPSVAISEKFDTLSSEKDRLWPNELWPPLVLNNGLKLNSSGGHGPIGYYVSNCRKGKFVEFTFTRPKEFVGIHKFEVLETSNDKTVLRHTINMEVNLKGYISWCLAIKWLHDALLEDCLDKVHNQVSENQVRSPHNFWVKFLRNMLKNR